MAASGILARLFAPRPRNGGLEGRMIRVDQHPAAIYAIGDIHGCRDQLVALEAAIAADAAGLDGDAWLVTLGDVVDRGPASAQVVDHVRGPAPAGLKRINLMGNHEAMMLDFLERPRAGASWLESGGFETLASYGIPHDKLMSLTTRTAGQLVESYVPAEHVEYLRGLPVLVETPRAIFVHAGLRPGVRVEAQRLDDLIWYRDGFSADFAEFGKPVVHGHTMRESPLVTPFRIAIDTAAVEGGPLTAVRIDRQGAVKLLSAGRRVDRPIGATS